MAKISVDSPIGRALLGKKVGEKVDVQVPAGKVTFRSLRNFYLIKLWPASFSKIVAGEIPCYTGWRKNANYLAFLDVFPLRKGHTLVIPKKEVDYIFDLDSETYTWFNGFLKT